MAGTPSCIGSVTAPFTFTPNMIRNYLRLAYRNILKNKIPSFVNIAGLSLAIGCAIVVFLFLEKNLTMDRFHENGDHIFLVENIVDRSGKTQLYGDSPLPLGPMVEKDITQVKRAVRVAYGQGTFQAGEQVLRERLWFADEDLLDMFSFALHSGNSSALTDPNAIVLSDQTATKFFGETDPIGEQISITYDNDQVRIFTVRAVAEPFSTKSSFNFRALISFQNYSVMETDFSDWSKYVGATFLEIADPSRAPEVLTDMESYLDLQNAASEDWPIAEFRLENLYNLSQNSQNVSGDISGGTHPAAIIVLGLVAIFLLLLSSFNYINLAIASASRRLKEIGIRKVVGATRKQLVGQFLSENVLLCALALFLGFIIAYFFFIPGFNNLLGDELSFSAANPAVLWIFLASLLLLTGVIAGAYPAFYIASFKPTAIFRGSQKIGAKSMFTRSLLTFQFVLAFLTMIMGVILAQNANYQAGKDWGYASEHRLVLRVADGDDYALLSGEMSALSGVSDIVGSRNHFGRSWNTAVLDIEGEKFEADRFDVGPGYIESFGLVLVAGRTFSEMSGSNNGANVIINELFAATHEWSASEALDRSFRQDSVTYTVIGVVNDFMYDDFYDPIEPAIIRIAQPDEYRFLIATVVAGSGSETAESARAIWKRLFPTQEYTGFFQDEIFNSVFEENTSIKQLFSFIAFLALVIACMGLFGLAVQNVIHRMKEISIRKVLGASLAGMMGTMNVNFLILIVLAAVLASPLGYFAMIALLDSVYADPISIGIWPFILSFGFVFVAASATISSQVYRIANNSPAEVLRSE